MEAIQSAPREVTVEEAIKIAVDFQRQGRVEHAGKIFDRILAHLPDHPAALHFGGILKHQQGDTTAGIAMIERSIAADPANGDAYTNLGNLLKKSGQLAPAEVAYRQAIALNPGDANAFSNLGVVLRAEGRLAEAEAAYRTAIELAPEHGIGHYNLGTLLAAQHRHAESIDCFVRAVPLLGDRVDAREARRILARSYGAIGETEKARELYVLWLEDEPDNVFARHMLAACSGRDVPLRAGDGFVETVFDGFAASFDEVLSKLHYRAPSLIGARIEDLGLARDSSLDVLDAGCGTGLCGPLLAPYTRRLTGVDLSAGMLAAAKKRGGYDELVKAELTEFLAADAAGRYDLIVSADTLVYFGALEAVVAAAGRALRRPGHFLFTLERSSPSATALDYTLEAHGRYSHDEQYVRRTLEASGFAVTIIGAELRMESGLPVAGLLVDAELGAAPVLTAEPTTEWRSGDAPDAPTAPAGESHA
jgi:predicted TPR repeat methyltransferase